MNQDSAVLYYKNKNCRLADPRDIRSVDEVIAASVLSQTGKTFWRGITNLEVLPDR